MRALCWAVIIAMASTSLSASAQGKKDKKGNEYQRAQTYMNAPPVAQARVARLLINPFGEVDGVLLDIGTIVTFPPHMGEQLAAAVKAGDPVIVKGYQEAPTQIKGYVITNAASNQTVMTQPKPPAGMKLPKHIRAMGLKEMKAQGEVRQVRFGGRGEINGVILGDGTIVRFPRDASYRFASLFQAGQRIAAAGYGTQNQFGQAFEATALGSEGQAPQPLYTR
jgi:hypothetical protein